MRGRFQPGGNNVTGGDMIGNNNLLEVPNYNEIPNYNADLINFSLKVFSGGMFNEISTEYVGGRYDYFDLCSRKNMCMEEMKAMVAELGYGKGFYALWYVIPGKTIGDGLMPIESTRDLMVMVDLVIYSKLIRAYVTSKPFSEFGVFGGEGLMDFSFTQLLLDQREERVADIIDEVVEGEERCVLDYDTTGDIDDENTSFRNDSSNCDSTDSEMNINLEKDDINEDMILINEDNVNCSN